MKTGSRLTRSLSRGRVVVSKPCVREGSNAHRMATTETRRMVLAAAVACEDKKAEDTRMLELDTSDLSTARQLRTRRTTGDRKCDAVCSASDHTQQKKSP